MKRRLRPLLVLHSASVACITALSFGAGPACFTSDEEPPAVAYEGSSFAAVWAQISTDPYVELPQQDISFGSLVHYLESKIREAADRTLSDRSDLLPTFQKLAHPNGVCLKGRWHITDNNPYSGYFKQGSEALMIARASVAMSETTVGHDRAFGFAGKLFPTNNQDEVVETANFFTVDDLGGTKAAHYTDVALTNSPPTSITSEVIHHVFYGIKLAVTFGQADQHSGERQLYEIAEAGIAAGEQAMTPRWIKINASAGQTKDAADFRDELNIANRAAPLVFEISVADPRYFANGTPRNAEAREATDQRDWARIGTITFEQSIASDSCDHRLHFHHPRWKD